MANIFGEKLAEIRAKRNLSLAQMADVIGGTSKQVIFRYEKGQSSPSIATAEEFAEKLNVPLSFLLGAKSDFTEQEIALILNFRKLNEDDKDNIQDMIARFLR